MQSDGSVMEARRSPTRSVMVETTQNGGRDGSVMEARPRLCESKCQNGVATRVKPSAVADSWRLRVKPSAELADRGRRRRRLRVFVFCSL